MTRLLTKPYLLSFGPASNQQFNYNINLVSEIGFEPMTAGIQSRYSTKLSYTLISIYPLILIKGLM